MASISSSLTSAVQALNAETGALQVTNNNIANANTPGYSRQVAVFQEAAPTDEGNLSVGNGVVLEGFQSVRDQLVTSQIQQETQAQGGANAQLASLQQIQPTFTTSTQDIGTQMSALFASLSSLSTDPTSSASREASTRSRAESGPGFQPNFHHVDCTAGRAQHPGHAGCHPDQPNHAADCGFEPADCPAYSHRAGWWNASGSAEPVGAESIGPD